MPEESTVINFSILGLEAFSAFAKLIETFRTSQHPDVRTYWDLIGVEFHMNLRALLPEQYKRLPEATAFITVLMKKDAAGNFIPAKEGP